MDWRNYVVCVLLALLPLAKCWTPIKPAATQSGRQKNAVSPYIDIVFCPIKLQPWSCAREQSARILDIWDNELHSQWQKLKVEADRQLNATIEKRGYSASEIPTKEKPSTILKKIEIGTDFMKQYLAESMDGFLGHEFDLMQNDKNQPKEAEYDDDDEEHGDDADESDEALEESPAADDDADDDDNDDDYVYEDDIADDEQENTSDEKSNNVPVENVTSKPNTNANTFIAPNANSYNSNYAFDADKTVAVDGSNVDEFFEIQDTNHEDQLKQPLDKKIKGTKRRKNKKKKGHNQQVEQHPATLVVVQQAETQHDVHELQPSGNSHKKGGHKKGDKRKKRKKRPGHSDSVSTVIVEEAPSNHLGFELLEELVGEQELLSSGGGGKRKHKNKISSNYGRSNGVTRGKKKKKRKAIAKLLLLGTFLKAKIELLLKILGAHLQIKFFAIALIGLLINIARFWIDVKRGGVPQKVIYVEHAHHQHHYEDHGDDWSESGGGGAGGYWKRSLHTDEPTVTDSLEHSYTDSYQPLPPEQLDAHYLAYRNQWH